MGNPCGSPLACLVRLWEGETLSSSPSAPQIGEIFVRCEGTCPSSLLEVAGSVVCRRFPYPLSTKTVVPAALEEFYLDFLGLGWLGVGVLGETVPSVPYFLSFLKPESHPGAQQSLKSGSLFRNELSSPCLAPLPPAQSSSYVVLYSYVVL